MPQILEFLKLREQKSRGLVWENVGYNYIGWLPLLSHWTKWEKKKVSWGLEIPTEAA